MGGAMPGGDGLGGAASPGAPGSTGPEALRGLITQAGPMVSRVLGQLGLPKTAAAFAQETSGTGTPKKRTPKKTTGASKSTGQTTPKMKAKEHKGVSVGKPTVRPKAAKEATRATPPKATSRRPQRKGKG